MAMAPKAFIQSFLKNRGSAPAPAAPAAAPSKRKPRKLRARVQRVRKKKPDFFRTMAKAVAGEVLRGTGHIGKHVVHKLSEDATGSGGMPTNNASSGAVSGLGSGSQEPGVKKGKKKTPLMNYGVFVRAKGMKND